MTMNRREFLATSCLSCLAGSLGVSLLAGCGALPVVRAPIVGSDLVVPLSEFPRPGAPGASSPVYLLVHNDRLEYPVCIYREAGDQYHALWLQCTHQGTELQVVGDRIECTAHGSQFDSRGTVLQGPASANLRSFPVLVHLDHVRVSLK
jgi:nitrite reductase/ring-hydroxylating ferredoxin subunit